MKTFLVGENCLTVRKQQLEVLLDNLYYENFGRDRLKHLTINDSRLPKLKITGDLISFSIFFKDKSGKENKVIIDGTIFLNEITLDTFTFENKEVNKLEEKSYIELLKRLTEICDGYIMLSINGKPSRIKNGVFNNEKNLLDELFSKIPNENKDDVKVIYDWLICCSKGTI